MRGLMNSRAPISGLERPSRARRAIWSSLGGEFLPGLNAAFASALAGGPQLLIRPRRERLDAHVGKHPVGDAQLLTRVEAATLPTQPLPVLQMRAGQLHANAGSSQPLDRLYGSWLR